MSLTPKQARFVEEYLIDLNATQAAIRAGYSENTAAEIGRQNLIKLEIAEAISEAQEARSDRTLVTQDRVLKELARVGFSDLRSLMTPEGSLTLPDDWDDDTAAAVSSIEVVTRPTGETDEDGRKKVEHVHKLKVWDKVSALEKMGKHLGMFVDRHELSGKDGGAIDLNVSARERLANRIAGVAARSGTPTDPE